MLILKKFSDDSFSLTFSLKNVLFFKIQPFDINTFSGGIINLKLRMPKSLHKELYERSRREGISMNQYCIYHQVHWDNSLEIMIYIQ